MDAESVPESPTSGARWVAVPGRMRAGIERFARGQLGCTCPDEVFSRIEQSPDCSPGEDGISRRLAIGGRLLVQVAEPASLGEALERLAGWVRAGCADRDRLGHQRLRLVICLDDPPADALAALDRALCAIPGIGDEAGARVHVHCLPRTALLAIMPAPASQGREESSR